MNLETLKLMNYILLELKDKKCNSTLPLKYYDLISKSKIEEYIKFELLKDFTKEDLKELKGKIFNIGKNYYYAGITCKENKVTRVLLPELSNILSSIIIVHELTHYVAYKNKLRNFSYMSLFDEVIPINSEFKFLLEFYKDMVKLHEEVKFNSVISTSEIISNLAKGGTIEDIENKDSIEAINKLSHIYSSLLLMQNNDYNKNSMLFDTINRTSNPLEYEFHKNGIYLRKNIINEIKKH